MRLRDVVADIMIVVSYPGMGARARLQRGRGGGRGVSSALPVAMGSVQAAGCAGTGSEGAPVPAARARAAPLPPARGVEASLYPAQDGALGTRSVKAKLVPCAQAVAVCGWDSRSSCAAACRRRRRRRRAEQA